MESFCQFIVSSDYLKSAFSDLFDEQKEQITPEILAHMNIFKEIAKNPELLSYLAISLNTNDETNNKSRDINFSQLQQLLEHLSENRDLLPGFLETFETGYLGEAIVYEFLRNSNKYSKVEWLAKSEDKTDQSVELNGTVYYINEKGEHYDLYAEDFEHKKHYFEVKSTKYHLSSEKLCFYLSGPQYKFASNMNDDENFYLVLVINTREEPHILILQKQNI